MKKLILLAALVLIQGCGPSDATKAEKEKYRKESAARVKNFHDRGPVVTTELKTADGVLRHIEIPIKESSPMVKRCVLFVANSGSQSLTCSEPEFAELD